MALATLEQLKRQLGFKDSDTQYDAKLTFFLDAASSWVESYCNRIFSEDTYTETLHGNGSNMITPRQWPVTAVSELRTSQDREWSSSDSLVASTDYGIDQDGMEIVLFSSYFPVGYNVVQVTYTGGYSTIPDDLQFACVLTAEWFYKHNNRGDSGRTSVGKQGENVAVLADIPPMIRTLLQPYKRFELPNSGLAPRHV
jgi:hypothetical protein